MPTRPDIVWEIAPHKDINQQAHYWTWRWGYAHTGKNEAIGRRMNRTQAHAALIDSLANALIDYTTVRAP